MIKINYFFFYILFLFVLSSFYLSAVYLGTTNNSMAEWVLNYAGGFVRRGIIGELISQISVYLKSPLRVSFLIFQIFIYLIYYVLIYWLFSKLKKNFFMYLAILSPVFFSFGLYELEALGRKEIVMYIFFLLNFYLFEKFKNINIIYFSSYISLIILLLNHESVVFYLLFYLFFFLILDKKKNFRFFLLNFFLVLIIISISSLIILSPQSTENNTKMCNFLLTVHQETCNFPAFFIMKGISSHIVEVAWKFNDVITYIVIFILGFGPIFLLISKSYFTSMKNIFNLTPLKIIFLCCFPGLSLFLIAVDSGRWTSMLYHMVAIFYFGMIKLKEIDINFKLKIINFKNIKYNFFTILILFLLCFSWNPKAVYHEGIGSFPAYRMIVKVKKFTNNFKDSKHIFNKLKISN